MLDIKGLNVLRRNAEAFIRADPIMVTLERTTKVESGAGGFVKSGPTALPPQRFRLVPWKRRLTDFTARTANGAIPVTQYALVGNVRVDINRDDRFTYQGDVYIVDSLEPKTADRSRSDRVVALLRTEVSDKNPPVV